MVGGTDSGLAGLHVGDLLPDKLFTISKNWLVLGGHLSPVL